MARPIGRPLLPRTDTERLEYLEKLLGFGRNRRDISIGYAGASVVVHAGPAGFSQAEVGAGVDLRTALDRAISRKAKP